MLGCGSDDYKSFQQVTSAISKFPSSVSVKICLPGPSLSFIARSVSEVGIVIIVELDDDSLISTGCKTRTYID